MSGSRARFFTWSLLLGSSLVACGGVDPARPGADLSTVAGDMSPLSTLCSDPRADVSGPGLTKTTQAGAFTVKLSALDPISPAIGTNVWTLDVADAAGKPVDGATFTIKPWMPDHGHGTQIVPSATPMGVPGEYQIKPLYLFMAGLWQITFTVQSAASSTPDTVVFSVCLADV
jgi:hypothetical protein